MTSNDKFTPGNGEEGKRSRSRAEHIRRGVWALIPALILAAMSILSGCANRPADRLGEAGRLVDTRPDSAYTILRDIDFNDLGEDSLKARYILLKALTNARMGRSYITDTLLADAASYYISTGDTANWALASQLLAGYDFVRGDSEAALRRLEDMLPRIKNPSLMWDTRTNLLELSINSRNYDKAYGHADWLLRHTDRPEQNLKFAAAKGAARYQQGDFKTALAIFDSIISEGVPERVGPEVASEFYGEYAEILDGAGRSREAIAITDRLSRNPEAQSSVERTVRKLSLAQFHANAGNPTVAARLLDSINLEATRSVFEVYASAAMLKAAVSYKETGRFPSELMHEVTKTLHRNYRFAQTDRQTALESLIELNEDNYELKLQRQRLWLLICGILLVLVVSGVAVYIALSRRKRRMTEAEERAETLERMLRETERAEEGNEGPSDSEKLRAALLRQLGIFKTFAGTPTPQSRDALRKISTAGSDGTTIESLVDWPEFYSIIDNLYDGFHRKLIARYPDTFNDKEQQIIVLLKAGFSTKEIGVLTEQSSATIYTRKSVIRRKLGSPESGDIIARIEE